MGLAASVSVWSVGSALDKNYSNDNRSGSSAPQSANAFEGSGGQRADSDAGRQAQGGSNQSGVYLNNFDKDSSNPNRSSTKSVGSIMGSAISKVKAAAPTQASLQAEIDAGGVASGTTARISGEAKVEVGDAIFVTSDAGLKYLQFAGALAGGYVGAGAGISVSTLANNSTAQAGGILTSGIGGIAVRSINNENAQGTGVAGAIGFVAIGAAVAIVNDASVVQSAVSDAAVVNTSGPVSITANDNRTMNTNTYSVSAGTVAIGASFSGINLKNDSAIETQAVIGNGATINARSFTLVSTPNFTATADTLGVAGGIIAGTVNFAFVDAQPESKAMIGSSIIVAGGEIAISSLAKYDLTAKGTGVAVGLGAVGLMYADVNLGRGDGIDEVTAGMGAARIASGKLNVRANSDDKLFAKSVAGSAALISVTGALAFTSSDQAARTAIGNDAIINTGTLGLYSTHTADIDSISDAITVAAASGQAGLTRNVNTGTSNVSVGNFAVVSAIELYVNATNELVKNKADDTKPVGQQYRNNIDAQSFKIFGLDVLISNSNLGTPSNPLAANVTFATGSRVTAASIPFRSSVFDVSTSTRLIAHDFVNIESISLLGAISAGYSIIDAVTQSKITVEGATLVNEDSAVSLSTRSYADNSPDAKLLVVSGLSGIAAAKVRADTTATSQVDVNNATIKGQSVAILSGKYNSPSAVGINLLDSHAGSTVRTASLIPSGVFDSVQSTLRENNFVNITGSSKVLAIGDVDLVARNGFSSSKIDKQVSAISIIPSFSSDSNNGTLLQSNLVNIANSARVEAGLGSNVTYKIEPLKFNNVLYGPDPSRIGQSLSFAEKTSRLLPTDVDFVFAPLAGGNISMPILNGYVFRLISGAAGSGVIGSYYQYIGGDASIVPHTTLYANTSLWRQLSQSEINALPGSEFVVYPSDITKNFAAGLAGKYYVIKPADSAQPILSLRNVGNLLIKQYDDTITWMANHSGNSEAIARYQAQLLTLEAQLNDLGLLAPDKVNGRQIVNKGLDVLFVDLPSLTASPGSIYIEQTGAAPSAFSSKLAGGQLRAHADAKIDIVNSSPFTMTTNGVKMLDGRRVVTVDGKYLTLQPGNVYVNFASLTNVNVNSTKSVRIVQEGLLPSIGYDTTDLPPLPSLLSQDLYINNGVDNANGSVEIRNASGSIYISGDVRGSTVIINAKNNLSIYSDGWYHLADPRQYLDFNTLDNDAAGAGPDLRTFVDAALVTDGNKTLATAIFGNQSRIVSQGRLSLTARFLNLNGLVQSGIDSIDLSIANAFVPPSGSTTFSALADQYANYKSKGYDNLEARLPTAIPGVTFGSQDVPFDVTWDAQQKSFNLGKLQPTGGEIIIAGQILSSGGGKLKVASGYASVNIQNDTPYKVVLDEIDTTKNCTGKITVIDSDRSVDRSVSNKRRPLQTVYTINATGIQEAVSEGTLTNGRIVYRNPVNTQYGNADIVNFLPEPGLQYVWVEGQTLSQLTRETFQKKSFNLTGGIFNGIDDALVADSKLINTEILARGEPRRLLYSETREYQGAPGVPVYANDKVYSLSYVQKIDTVIVARNNVTLVRNPPRLGSSVVYKYVGPDNTTLDMATTNYGDMNLWVNSGQSGSAFVPSPPDNRFDSDNRNIVYDRPEVHGGGWLSEKTITTRRTINTGLKDFFAHTLKADYPVRIEISRSAAQPNVSIASVGGVKLAGNIQVPSNGNASLTSSGGSIDSIDSVAIYANSPQLVANGFIDVQIEGNRGPVNALAGGDISLTAISKDNLNSRVDVGAVVSTGGDVQIIAADGIQNATVSSSVAGSRVELFAQTGAIGTLGSSLNVNSAAIAGRTNGGLAAWAKKSVIITETLGDMILVRPVTIVAGTRTRTPIAATASVQSDTGNVTLTSASGSIRDGYYESLISNPILVANMTAREQLFFNTRLTSGAITAQQLSNPLTPEMAKFLYPHTAFSLPSAPSPTAEQPNVRGALVTLTAATAGAQIGLMGDRISIVNPNNFSTLPAAQAALLAQSTPGDVIGVQYSTYRYLGATQNAVDLTAENFGNTVLWQRISANILTGPSDAVPINRALTTGQRVLVEFNTQDYGLYEYKGSNGTFELVTQNYRHNSRWQKVVAAAATDGGPANLTNGMIVSSKYTIDSMTIRRVDDVNVEATSSIIAIANNRVALESNGDARLQRIVAGSDVQVLSAADILDVGLASAAIASGGQVRLAANNSIAGIGSNVPLRTQIAPSGSLISQSGFTTTIQQVATDTFINSVATPINSLFVPMGNSTGAMMITVSEGDLSLGALSSSTSIELVAAGSILDAYPDGLGRRVNVTTAAAPLGLGNVRLSAGDSIGTATNSLDMMVGGELTSVSGTSTTINHIGNLVARSMIATGGNVTINNSLNLFVDKISAVNGFVTIISGLSVIDINASASSMISTIGGWLMLLSGDDVTLAGAMTAKNVYVYGDYQNRDSQGSQISIGGTINSESAEVTTDVENDVVMIAAAITVGFVVRVGKGDDEVTTGNGNDQIYGGPGRDRLRGGAGNDTIDGGGGVGDELYGEAGNDTIYGSDDGAETDPDFFDNVRFGDDIDPVDHRRQLTSCRRCDLRHRQCER